MKAMTAAVALLLTAAHLTHAAAPPAASKNEPARAALRLAKAWDDLASEDDTTASRALLTLAASPKEAVALLKARLVPVKVEPARVKKLLEQLDDDEFDHREAASRELEYLGRFGKPLLQKALESDDLKAEAKKRVTALLARIPPADGEKAKQPPAVQGRNI